MAVLHRPLSAYYHFAEYGTWTFEAMILPQGETCLGCLLKSTGVRKPMVQNVSVLLQNFSLLSRITLVNVKQLEITTRTPQTRFAKKNEP